MRCFQGHHKNAFDPREQLTGILLTQRMMDSPPPRVMADFWTSAYQAIDD